MLQFCCGRKGGGACRAAANSILDIFLVERTSAPWKSLSKSWSVWSTNARREVVCNSTRSCQAGHQGSVSPSPSTPSPRHSEPLPSHPDFLPCPLSFPSALPQSTPPEGNPSCQADSRTS